MEELGTSPSLGRQHEGYWVRLGSVGFASSHVPSFTLTWSWRWRNHLLPRSSPVLGHLCSYYIDPSTLPTSFGESRHLLGITVATHVPPHTLLPQALAAAPGLRLVLVCSSVPTSQMGAHGQAQRGKRRTQITQVGG